MEENEQKLIERLLNSYLKPIFNFAYRLSRNKEDAEDIAQETFFKAWRSLDDFDPNKNEKAWIFTIARNTAIDFLRKRKNLSFADIADDEDDIEERLSDTSQNPEEIFAAAERKKVLENLLDSLSPSQKQIVLLKYENAFTFEEIGQILGRPLNTVKSQYRRALARLHQKLTDQRIY